MRMAINRKAYRRNIGQNRNKARLWIEGKILLDNQWAHGDSFDCRFEQGRIVYEKNKAGSRKVAGTSERPIIDTNTDKIIESIPDVESVQIVFEGKGKRMIVITA